MIPDTEEVAARAADMMVELDLTRVEATVRLSSDSWRTISVSEPGLWDDAPAGGYGPPTYGFTVEAKDKSL